MAKRDGRFSGEAFVVLSSPLQIQMAEDKNKSYMGRRYVEVFRAKKQVGGAAGSSTQPMLLQYCSRTCKALGCTMANRCPLSACPAHPLHFFTHLQHYSSASQAVGHLMTPSAMGVGCC